MPKQPRLLQQLRAAERAVGFSASEKSVLLAWPCWADEQGEAFPSVETVARATGLSERTIQKTFRRLEDKGVFTVVSGATGGIRRSGFGISKRRRLNYDVLAAAGKGATDGAEGRSPAPEWAQPATGKGESAAPKPPSNHHLNHQINHHEEPPGFKLEGDGMDGRISLPGERDPDAVRAALRRAGVRGANLDKLTAMPHVTPERIREEWEDLAWDRSVQDKVAVFVRRLANGESLRSKYPYRGPAPISADLLKRFDTAKRAATGSATRNRE